MIIKKINLMMITFALILLAMPQISAEPSFIFRQSTDVDLKISCVDSNNNPCSSTTACSITINYPNATNLVQNGTMTFNSQFYNYTLNSSQTSTLGIYSTSVFCNAPGFANDGFSTFTYSITATGTEPSITQGIIYLIGILLLAFLFSLSLIGAIRIPWSNNKDFEGRVISMNDLKYAKLFLWFASYLLLISLVWLAWNISDGFLGFNTAGNIFNMIFWFLMAFLFPLLVIFILMALINLLTDRKIKEALSRNIPYRE